MKLTAYDLGKKPFGEADPLPPLPYTRAEIRHYPHRTVATNTALSRLRRDPAMSLHDACTVPLAPRGKPRPACIANPRFLADLQTDEKPHVVAARWGLHFSTIKRYRSEGLPPQQVFMGQVKRNKGEKR